MTVQNKYLHILTWLIHLISTFVYVMIVYSIYLTRFYENITPNVPRDYYTVFFGIIYIIVLFYPNMVKYHYVYYSDGGDFLVFKTYPVGFFTARKQTFRIPKKDFIKAELRESLFRLRKALIIYQNINNKVAKYPPVYINGLPREDQKKILLSLSRLMVGEASASQHITR